MRRLGALVAAAAVLAAVLVAPATAAAAADDAPEPVAYRPPVDAPIRERFRPPATRYGSGNRGVDYESPPGTVVTAAADGEVVFAGRIGASSHVTVLHADGIRTSYSFLSQVVVRRGDRVVAGQPIGATEAALHFGARAGEEYVDPLALLGGGEKPKVRLIPDDVRRPLPEHQERTWIEHAVRGLNRLVIRPSAEVVGRMRQRANEELQSRLDELMLAVHYTRDAVALPLELVEATRRWNEQRGSCSTQERAPPPAPRPQAGRRIVVLVGGLGSSSEKAAVFATDTAALGYHPNDVHRFSYRGVGQHYGPPDTTQDIAVSANRLTEHVDALRRRHPGAQIDVIAHSQGGLVARKAAVDGMKGVTNLVTLGTPHNGTDLATAAALIAHSDVGEAILEMGGTAAAGIDPTATSVAQMGEHSSFIRDLNSKPLPEAVRFRSIAARGDLVVPSPRSRIDGGAGTNTIVEVEGALTDHDSLPASPQATREIALALAGLPATCRTLADHAADVIAGELISTAEDAVAVGAAYGLRRLDDRAPKGVPGLG